jgi:hypothetical protein
LQAEDDERYPKRTVLRPMADAVTKIFAQYLPQEPEDESEREDWSKESQEIVHAITNVVCDAFLKPAEFEDFLLQEPRHWCNYAIKKFSSSDPLQICDLGLRQISSSCKDAAASWKARVGSKNWVLRGWIKSRTDLFPQLLTLESPQVLVISFCAHTHTGP